MLPGPGPVVLATSTTILRGVGRVLLELPMMAVFSAASLSMTMSILHVGLVLRIELQLHRDVKPVRTPVAIFGSLGVCIYVRASRHWMISYSPIHLT